MTTSTAKAMKVSRGTARRLRRNQARSLALNARLPQGMFKQFWAKGANQTALEELGYGK